MKSWGSLKTNYFNQKAQSLTELASFGSVLLLVVSFIISYGMRLNYQQDAQMRVFRMAMSDAYNNVDRPDATSSITLIDDKHVPDPRDRFGLGSVIPVQAGAAITWGNTMQDEYVDASDYTRMKYVINGTTHEYTTEAYATIYKTIYSGFYADILGQRRFITWANVTCYWPTPDSPKQARVSLGNTTSELIGSIYLPLLDSAGAIIPGKVIEQNLPIVGVVPADAANEATIDGFAVRTPAGGAINPYFTQLNGNTGKFDASSNPIYVTPGNMQGLLSFDTVTNAKRNDSLKIVDTGGSGKTGQSISTVNYDLDTTITRKIKTNSGLDVIVSNIKRSINNKIWTTAK
jgi:hypothetical protein